MFPSCSAALLIPARLSEPDLCAPLRLGDPRINTAIKIHDALASPLPSPSPPPRLPPSPE